jgi:hypothetical protein
MRTLVVGLAPILLVPSLVLAADPPLPAAGPASSAPASSSSAPASSSVAAAPAPSAAAPEARPTPAADTRAQGPGAPPDLTPSRTLPVAGAPLRVALPRARGGRPLRWRGEWSRFDGWDAVFSALAGASALTTAIVRPIYPYRRGGILFDEAARNALRAPSYDSRGLARDASDVLLSLSLTAPFLVDSLSIAYWYRGSADVAAEMALIDSETFLATAAVQGLFNTFTARERPYGRTCGKDIPESSLDCDSNDRFRSFFSGHTAMSFASASLVCSHHLTLDLFDSRSADIGACVTGYVAAAATGTLRIVGDKHYASDVLTGAIVGASMGFAVPYFLHYRLPRRGVLEEPSALRWHLLPSTSGASVVGVF